jgi:hypothetical protein
VRMQSMNFDSTARTVNPMNATTTSDPFARTSNNLTDLTPDGKRFGPNPIVLNISRVSHIVRRRNRPRGFFDSWW